MIYEIACPMRMQFQYEILEGYSKMTIYENSILYGESIIEI